MIAMMMSLMEHHQQQQESLYDEDASLIRIAEDDAQQELCAKMNNALKDAWYSITVATTIKMQCIVRLYSRFN